MTRPLSNSHLIPSNGPLVASTRSLLAWRLLLSHPCSSFVLVMRVHVADQFQARVPVIPGRLSPGARSFPKLRGAGPRAPLRRPVLPLGGSSTALASVFANSFFKRKKKFFFHDFYCGEILGICFSRFPDLRSISALLFTCSNIPNKLGLRSAPTAWPGPRSGRRSACRPRFPGTAEVVCARCPVTRDREPLFGGLLREDAPLPGLKRRLGDTCIGSGQVA